MSFRINETYICSVVFMDIVRYSAIPNERQRTIKSQFNNIVADALSSTSADSRLSLDTGDGAAIGFLWNPEHALQFARSVGRQFAASSVLVRIGMNLGPVTIVKDINDRYNMVGDGINAAQRIMDFAGQGQIFASQSYYEAVKFLSGEYPSLFMKRDAREDKHGRKHLLYEIKDAKNQASSARSSDLLIISDGIHSGLLSPPSRSSNVKTPSFATTNKSFNYNDSEESVSSTASPNIQFAPMPIDSDLRMALEKFGTDWSETQCWPRIWSMLSDPATRCGLDERTVRRRGKILWDAMVVQQESARMQTRQDQIRADKLSNASQKNHDMHLKQLFDWQKKLNQGKWNYAQWDDFIDSLAQPVDIKALEKARDSRFVFDEMTAIDKKFWLMWSRSANLSAESRVTWSGAKKVVEIMNRQNYAGYDDWRLPTKVDLENMMLSAKDAGFGLKTGSGIVDYFNSAGFQECLPNEYWSSSIHAIDDKSAWFVDFEKGFTYFMNKSNVGRVWAIRKI